MFKKIFKKNRGDVVDLADLQRRGLLKPRVEGVKSSNSGSNSGVIDLTESKTEETSPLGFLGSLVGASETKEDETTTEIGTTVIGSERKSRLKGVLRDMKLEMKNTSDKVYKISERIDLLEKKLERLERRSGYGQ